MNGDGEGGFNLFYFIPRLEGKTMKLYFKVMDLIITNLKSY